TDTLNGQALRHPPDVTGGQRGNPGAQGGSELTGTTGVPGSIAYHDLRMTDNPYDPKFATGIATVGALIPQRQKKPNQENNKSEGAQPENIQQKH
ncbi:MAG: hypothetical protein ACREPT_00705, partial [Rudaea sp.]